MSARVIQGLAFGLAPVAPVTVDPEESDRAAARICLRQAADALRSAGLDKHARNVLEGNERAIRAARSLNPDRWLRSDVSSALTEALRELHRLRAEENAGARRVSVKGPIMAAIKACGVAWAMQVPT